ncbi:hypothetical protein HK096_007690, partial [Nowakowskiella sp. JEL0078]
ITEPIYYYSKILFSFASQVTKHQKVTLPLADFFKAQEGYARFFATLQNGQWRKVTLKDTRTILFKGIEIGGFFLVGEMIGRFNIIGYKIPG